MFNLEKINGILPTMDTAQAMRYASSAFASNPNLTTSVMTSINTIDLIMRNPNAASMNDADYICKNVSEITHNENIGFHAADTVMRLMNAITHEEPTDDLFKALITGITLSGIYSYMITGYTPDKFVRIVYMLRDLLEDVAPYDRLVFYNKAVRETIPCYASLSCVHMI